MRLPDLSLFIYWLDFCIQPHPKSLPEASRRDFAAFGDIQIWWLNGPSLRLRLMPPRIKHSAQVMAEATQAGADVDQIVRESLAFYPLDLDSVFHKFAHLQLLTLFIVRLVHQAIYVFV